MDAQLKKGVLEVCVLAVIKKEPSYGYKIVSDVSQCIDISESTLYPILKRLESANALSTYSKEYNGRLRKYYQITDIGVTKIADFFFDFQELAKVARFIWGEENEQN